MNYNIHFFVLGLTIGALVIVFIIMTFQICKNRKKENPELERMKREIRAKQKLDRKYQRMSNEETLQAMTSLLDKIEDECAEDVRRDN